MVPFLKLGLVPDWGMMRSLPLRVGLAQARRLIFDTATVSGQEAHAIGLIDRFVPDGSVMDAAVNYASQLAQLPTGAVGRLKARLRCQPGFEQDLAAEEADQVSGLTGREFSEGFAAYMEKRKPDFSKL
jgi:2-(1,2-epoxy-1,2-dihydrophenyl)acetyl-CoA isomerase